jgi:hypothetical protein
VIIVLDDLGSEIRTPNIDKLATSRLPTMISFEGLDVGRVSGE